GRNGATVDALCIVTPEEGGLRRQIHSMLKAEIVVETVEEYAPSMPIRLDAPIPKNGGGRRQGAPRPGGKPANRPHVKPGARNGAPGHAGPKQHRGNGRPGRRGTRAG